VRPITDQPGSTLQRAVVGALVALAANGCALVVGDVNGDHLFDAAPAPEAGRDSTLPPVDAGGHEGSADGQAVDGLADAAPDAGPDTTPPVDAGSDATPVDAGSDATPADASSGDAADATAQDAGQDGGFCANFTKPAGATVYCDDFDENADPTVFGTKVVNANSTLTVQSTVALSPPNALAVTAQIGDASTAQSYLYLSPLATGSTFTVQFDVKVSAPGDGTGASQLGGLFFGDASITLDVVGATGNVVSGFALAEKVNSTGYFHVHPTIPTTNTGWVRLKLVVSPHTGGGFVDNFWVDGVQSVVETNYPLNAAFTVTQPTGGVGWQYVSGVLSHAATFDNVVFAVQ
jgi:hypothetical protein